MRTTILTLLCSIASTIVLAQKSYLALGDSYTKGESVAISESFPYQLQQKLKIDRINVIAETGWTTSNLINAYQSKKLDSAYDMVTILIGVNNFYQNKPIVLYRKELKEIFHFAAKKCSNKATVWVVSIPDYGFSAFGQSKNPKKIFEQTNTYNTIAQEMATEFGYRFIDITSISRSKDKNLIAPDGLHPSGYQYGLWVKKMLMNP